MMLSQHVLLQSGSFSGLRPLGRLGSDYLSATRTFAAGQPLCGNEEGWGPLSPTRWDFTPCFIDVWVAVVAAFGVLAGAAALAMLARIRKVPGSTKDWAFWAKQVRLPGGVFGGVVVDDEESYCKGPWGVGG
jgi:hypothetical protein